MMQDHSSTTLQQEWDDLKIEYKALEELHQEYLSSLEATHQLQQKCLVQLEQQKQQLEAVMQQMHISLSSPLSRQGSSIITEDSTESETAVNTIKKEMLLREVQLQDIEGTLPRESGKYLKVILGNINVSLLDKGKKFKYKEEYEKFKLILTMISIAVALLTFVFPYRFLDAIFHFLLVWYYCTLTIRESILRVNGSRIRGWWRVHHVISTVVTGIMITWSDGVIYQEFRQDFIPFCLYISIIQLLQYQYQKGCLYRLKALGEKKHTMDVTVDGFHQWMWKGLGFLLPFLFIGYFIQFRCAYRLYTLCFHPQLTEWQVPVLSVIFFILFVGNIFTTSRVAWDKIYEEIKSHHQLTHKYKVK